jgi:hypothetical protein
MGANSSIPGGGRGGCRILPRDEAESCRAAIGSLQCWKLPRFARLAPIHAHSTPSDAHPKFPPFRDRLTAGDGFLGQGTRNPELAAAPVRNGGIFGHVGSGQAGSGRVGSGGVGSSRVGSARVGSGRVESGQVGRVGPGRVGWGRVRPGRVGGGAASCRIRARSGRVFSARRRAGPRGGRPRPAGCA